MAKEHVLLRKFSSMKTLPHVALRLSKLISDENSSIKELENIIRLDPTLVLRLLRIVNSPYYGLQHKVESIDRAVVFIGMKNLRNMVVTEALKDIFKIGKDEHIYSRRQLWLHCAAVSICGQMISERIFEQKGEDVFLCGILHDIGYIVEDQVSHDSFIQACTAHQANSKPITDYENEFIGTNHCIVGYEMAREWRLPAEVQDGIKFHHKSLRSVSPSSVTGIIQIAEYIVSGMDYSAMPGMEGILSPPLADHMNDNHDEYRTLVRDLPDEMIKARELYESREG
jgi:putative nucleotidyltransferase with HDIG domain